MSNNNYPDNLKSTIYKRMAENAGVDVNALPDNLETTLLKAVADNMGSGGGASSWNDLTDKPFGEETATVNEPLNITWDGNLDGHLVIGDIPTNDDEAGCFVKVSNMVLTDEQIKTSSYVQYDFGDVASFEISAFWDAPFVAITEDFVEVPGLVFVRKSGAVVRDSVEFPKVGIYFSYSPNIYIKSFATTEPVEHEKTVVKKIDEKYLPDSVDGVVIRSSTADSTKKFKLTVDDSGTIGAVEIGGK